MQKRDSMSYQELNQTMGKNIVTREIQKMVFRNIYSDNSKNEILADEQKYNELYRYNDKIIRKVEIRQLYPMGYSVHDTMMSPNKIENFINKLHVVTKSEILKKRFILFKENEDFSAQKAMMNERLLRESGIFSDVRYVIKLNQDNTIDLIYYIQDNLPYNLGVDFFGFNEIGIGLENINIFGTTHRLSLYNRNFNNNLDPKIGTKIQYIIPNIFGTSFTNLQTEFINWQLRREVGMELSRNYSRPDITWAFGVATRYKNIQKELISLKDSINYKKINTDVWLSKAFPLKRTYNQLNTIILGASYANSYFFETSGININNAPQYRNSNLFLGSLGFSFIKFRQTRLVNNFGRIEDLPEGISIKLIYGKEFNQLNTRDYFGSSILAQYNNSNGGYYNFSFNVGTYSVAGDFEDGLIDANLVMASKLFMLGKFRLRTFLNTRYTLGINRDSSDFIRLSRDYGIHGINNFEQVGQNRITGRFQPVLYWPVSLLGFRFSTHVMCEIASNLPYGNFVDDRPLILSAFAGIGFKNDATIFNLFQFQYGRIHDISGILQSRNAFVITSTLPFLFKSLDISRTRVLSFE
jgi:hypothetical protein